MLDERPDDGTGWRADVSVNWKPSSNFSLSLGPQYMGETDRLQWVTKVDDPLMTSTYGSRYVFRPPRPEDRRAEVRLNWTFTPRLTLQAYLQPFLGVGTFQPVQGAGPAEKPGLSLLWRRRVDHRL